MSVETQAPIPLGACIDNESDLRQAVGMAVSDPASPTLLVVCSGVLTLTEEIDLTGKSVEFACFLGGSSCVISGGDTTRLFSGGPVLAIFHDLHLQEGSADFGGCLNIEGGTVTLMDNRIKDCSASASGGAIYVDAASTVSIQGGRIRDNVAGEDGGGIFAISSTVSIERTTLQGNEADGQGGAIMAEQDAIVTVQSATFRDNVQGGAVAVGDDGTVDFVVATVFTGNDPIALEISAGGTVSCDETVVFCGGSESILGDSDSCLTVAGSDNAEIESTCSSR